MNISSTLTGLGYLYNSDDAIWMHPSYPGIQYNDGDEVENRIANIIKDAEDITLLSTELRLHCTDWPSLYHLTGTRANIMRPFDAHYKDASVLEIGAGCGAITRYLGECGASVLALEGSPRRACIARSRTRDLSNVTVLAEKFDQFKCTEQFDVVTLIGVLEYANLFTPGDNPALSMLQRVRQLLKPEGKLIIAIENQLGLKYFAGAPEDHLGEPMVGIEGRYRKDQPQTYGRKKLQSLLSEAGFTNSSFLAPFPDYKLPVSIVTESGFAAKDFDAAAFAWQSARRDPQLPDYCNFSLELAWPEVVGNGLGLDLSNSFLICTSPKNMLLIAPNVLACHYSSNRKAEFSKETIFSISEELDIQIIYKSLAAATTLKIQDDEIINNICPPSSCYSIGKLLSMNFIEIVTRDNWSFDQVNEFFKKYIEYIKKELLGEPSSNNFFRQNDELTKNTLLPGHFFDYISQNIVIDANGDPLYIDKEWSVKTQIELGYLLYRSFFILLNQITRFGVNKNLGSNVTRHDLVNSVLDSLKLNINSHDVAKYVKLENQIQTFITGKVASVEADWLVNNILPMFNANKYSSELQKQLTDLNLNHKQRESHIIFLDAAVVERQNRIDLLDSFLSQQKSEFDANVVATEAIKLELKQARDYINDIKKSKSWLITKPFRYLSSLLIK